jgi:hypothetical protein
MPRPQHYSPAIERFLVSVLYHEARHRKIPMTRLANGILKAGLADSLGWRLATESRQAPDKQSVACQGKQRSGRTPSDDSPGSEAGFCFFTQTQTKGKTP